MINRILELSFMILPAVLVGFLFGRLIYEKNSSNIREEFKDLFNSADSKSLFELHDLSKLSDQDIIRRIADSKQSDGNESNEGSGT